MDFLVGIKGADFVILASDCSQARSIVVMKKDMDKSLAISPNTLMLLSGPNGDTVNFGEYIQKNLKLNTLRNGTTSTPWSNANYVRHELAQSLRSRGPYQVNLLLGGYGEEGCSNPGPQLYFIDYMASMAQVPYAAQGYGGFFTLSILDKHYKDNMNLQEASALLKRCISEVQHRFLAQMPRFMVHVVDKDGIRKVEDM
eukprot:m.217584 g.217584  ORF g.217584 m.217584 type:complete len:199 (+) comp19131_c0_seq4:48-644(+)